MRYTNRFDLFFDPFNKRNVMIKALLEILYQNHYDLFLEFLFKFTLVPQKTAKVQDFHTTIYFLTDML